MKISLKGKYWITPVSLPQNCFSTVLGWLALFILGKSMLALFFPRCLKMVCVNYFSFFQELRITWEVHHSKLLFILSHFIKVGTLLFPSFWHLTFPEQAVNNTTDSAETTPNGAGVTLLTRATEPRNCENIWFICKLLEYCLMAVLHGVRPGGVILAEEKSTLWQSESICPSDCQTVLHRNPLILSVVWLWSIDIVIALWKVLFGYFSMKVMQKYLLIQSIKISAKKVADKLLEYSLCTDKLLNLYIKNRQFFQEKNSLDNL